MRDRVAAVLALCCAGLIIAPSQAVHSAEANETARERTANEWYDLGISRVLNSNYVGAIEAYTKAIELNPGDFQWWRSLGDAQRNAGNHAAAIDAYRKMLVLNPTFAFGCKLLAEELGSTGSRDEAIHCFEEAIFRGQGDTFSASNIETYNSYRQSIGLASTTEADVVKSRNRRTPAVAAAAPKRLSKAQTQAQIQALLAEAQQLTSALENGKAFGKYREAVALDPTRADLHAAIGKAKLVSAYYDQEMVAELREAVRLDPGKAAYHQYLGNALSLLGQYPEAIAAQREAIRLEPTAERLTLLGQAQSGAGDLQAAIESYRNAIALDPKDAHRHAALGDELRRANRPQEAMAEYQRALEIIPSATPWRNSYNELRAATTPVAAVASANPATPPTSALTPEQLRVIENVMTGLGWKTPGTAPQTAGCVDQVIARSKTIKYLTDNANKNKKDAIEAMRYRDRGRACMHQKMQTSATQDIVRNLAEVDAILSQCPQWGPERAQLLGTVRQSYAVTTDAVERLKAEARSLSCF
jgi:tetratricopeptide (TPR) repeat protein